MIDQVAFTMSVKEKVVPLYETIFDIEYPLPKLDTLVVRITSFFHFDHITIFSILMLGVRF